MIIRRVKVRNIRSHRVTEITFNDGVTVIKGDIGAGKTSILYAIDFALFGLRPGELGGEELLRATENRGTVEIDIEVNGKTYTIGRSLVRSGDSVRVDRAWIVYPKGVRKEYSSSEVRAVIVRLLGIPEEVRATTHTRIFRTALYVPQNELTRILEERTAERREEIIMRLFDLDRYRIARENLSHLIRDLNRDRREAEEQLRVLGDVKSEYERGNARIKELKARIEANTARVKSLRGELEKLRSSRRSAEEERRKLQEESSRLNAALERLRAAEREILKLKDRIEKQMRELGLDLHTIGREDVERIASREKDRLKALEDELKSAEDELRGLARKVEQISRTISSLDRKLGGLEERKRTLLKTVQEVKRLATGKKCPLCKQPITEEHVEKIEEEAGREIRRVDEEISRIKREIEELYNLRREREEEIGKLQEQISRMKSEVVKTRYTIRQLEVLARDVEERERLEGDIAELKREIVKAAEITTANGIEDRLKTLREKLKRLDEEVKTLESLEAEKYKELLEAEAQLKADTRELELLKMEVRKLEEQMRRAEEIKRRLDKLKSTIEWLEKKFQRVLETAEREASGMVYHAFVTIFKQLAEELLGEAGIRVEVDPSYTPVIFQNIEGKEVKIRLENLSGGEAASVALAYRLALNYVARHRISALKEGTILLDEPSTGFSTEQLRKFRDVISKLGARQVIIVTHEDVLEDAADHIVRLIKRDGVSRVERVQTLSTLNV